MIIAGIDEAGRGPVIGPLVMAIAAIDEKNNDKLIEMGVKDSKLLSPNKRESLFEKIIQTISSYHIIIVTPKQIDDCLIDPSSNLNILEANTSIHLISKIPCHRVYLDCPSNNPDKYKKQIISMLSSKINIIAENKADVKYPIVSAAPILAKVTRDKEIESLKSSCGIDFGSGYPSDPKTIAFLRDNYKNHNFFRKTWASYKKHTEQSTLDRFK